MWRRPVLLQSVNEGHPNKLFTQISDAVLVSCTETPQARLLAKRRPRRHHHGCGEITTETIMVAGETSENKDRSAMPVAGPEFKDVAKRRQELTPGSVTEPPPMEVGMHWVKEASGASRCHCR